LARAASVLVESNSPGTMLLVHLAIRRLMHQAALGVDLDPDQLSFTRSLRVVRRQVTDQAALSP
jgi:hypothetical protein